jgi:cytochrome c oxidase assembly factor CtaG/polyferredoxin
VESIGRAAISSWTFDPAVIAVLVAAAIIYFRGWRRGRRIFPTDEDVTRLTAYLGGLLVLYLAIESPLDAFDSLFLSAHMAQHLLLMMVAPPLLLIGRPMLPFLRGLPRTFVKEGLGPFLAWPLFQGLLKALTFPPVAWFAYTASTILWHVPAYYELVLRSPFWHGVQHACFFWTAILFWWPVIEPGPGRSPWPRWTMIPYLLLADMTNTALSAFFIFSGTTLYPSYEAVHTGGMSTQQDQSLAGAIMWVPGSMFYLVPAIVVAVRLFSSTRSRQIAARPTKLVRIDPARPIASRFRLLRLRRAAQVLMLAVAVAVIADGFFGPQVTPLNLAGVLPWIHWRAFSLIALLAIGNLFCMACPFTLVRDMARRVLPAKLRWPRQLRTKWIAVVLLVLYLWAYEAFGLWDSPWLTAWVITGYFAAVTVVDGLFRGASFCKYVCPIGQFHFVNSLVSPGEIRVRSMAVCQSCRTHDCIRGNERARGCELYLFQPKKTGNMDCTFCLDCVKACPHDNVALLPTPPASTLLTDPYRSGLGRLSKRTDVAVMVLVIVFGAFVNAAGMVGPVMMWEHSWHARLGAHAMPYIVAAFVLVGVVIFPVLATLLFGAWKTQSARRFIFALAPVGFAMWCAHLLYHFATSWTAALPAMQRAIAGTVSLIPMPVNPAWLTPAQILLLDAGLLLTLYICWRLARQYATQMRQAIGLAAPWAVLSCVLYAAGVWILLQPMQMRGMLH